MVRDRWGLELDMNLDNFQRLEAEHCLNLGSNNLVTLLGAILLTSERVDCSRVGLGFDDLKWTIKVQVESQISL